MSVQTLPYPSSSPVFRRVFAYRSIFFGCILLVAWIAFEMFNYSTTHVSLVDLLGDIQYAGLSWATILSIAFCGIDFAGIARIFAGQPYHETHEKETWFLFAAWLLAGTMNALLTWWGVSIALISHRPVSASLVDPNLLLDVVPVVVACMVWVTRVLLIGTFTTASASIFRVEPIEAAPRLSPARQTHPTFQNSQPQQALTARPAGSFDSRAAQHQAAHMAPRQAQTNVRPEPEYISEPTAAYHTLSAAPRSNTAPRRVL